MSFLFSIRSTADQLQPSSRNHHRHTRSRNISNNTRMSTIVEDCAYTPRTISHRPASTQLHLETLPKRSFDEPPPAYVFSGARFNTGPGVKKLGPPVQETAHGGRRRLALLFLVIILGLVGVVLGLAIGLSHKSKRQDANDHGPDSSAPAVPVSPSSASLSSGDYTIDTVLDTISTNCTSINSTWKCFPYTTYSSSGSPASAASFIWTIQQHSSSNYTISAAPNSFAPTFNAIPLTLHDSLLPTERYTFSLPIIKAVIPSDSISNSNTAATCYYNSTTFQASLYTRMGRQYPTPTDNITAIGPVSISNVGDWPYAVEVMEVAGGGPDVPNCYDHQGHDIGNFVAQDAGQDCNCIYNNFGFDAS